MLLFINFDQRWHEAKGLVQCGAVAGLSNTGADCSVAFWTLVNFLGRWQGDDFVLAQLKFTLSFCSSARIGQRLY